jgi:hypothetical protein
MNLREISRGSGAAMPAFMRGGGVLQGRLDTLAMVMVMQAWGVVPAWQIPHDF